MAFFAARMASRPWKMPGAGALATMNQPSEKAGFPGAVVVDLARPVDIAEDLGEDARLARECGRGAEGSTAS